MRKMRRLAFWVLCVACSVLSGCKPREELGSAYLISRGFGKREEVERFERDLVDTLTNERFLPCDSPIEAKRLREDSGMWWSNGSEYVRIKRIHARDTLVQVLSVEAKPRIVFELEEVVQEELKAETAEENTDK